MIDHKLPNLERKEIVLLSTRYRPETGQFQIKAGNTWRQGRKYDEACAYCCLSGTVPALEYYRRGNYIPLEYYGYQDNDGVWVFWGVCIICQCRVTDFFWRGKPKEQRPTGGNGHGWLRTRRQSSRY